MRRVEVLCRAFIYLLIGLVVLASEVHAQKLPGRPIELRPKVGELIEVKFLGKWLEATVTAVARNRVQVSYEWVNRERIKEFDLAETRYPWQGRAITPAYLWKDSSGEHTIRAAAVDVDSAAQTVTLYRLDDGREITLPISRLGSIEQKRISVILKSENTRAVPLPPVQVFGSASTPSGFGAVEADLAGVEPDPPKIPVAVPMGGAGFAKLGFHEDLVGVFPIGSSKGWMLGATVPGLSAKDGVPARLIWATLSDSRVAAQHALDANQMAIAVHPASQQVLTVAQTDDRTPTLTVYRSSPKLPKADPVVRWESGKKVVFNETWGDFIDAKRVLHRTGRNEYTAYDFVSKRAVYRVYQESFFKAVPVLSPGRRYLALPEDKRVRILSSVDGRTVADLPIEGGSSSGVAFDAAGEKLAVLTRNQLAVWTLGETGPPLKYRSDSVGSPFAQSLAWVDEDGLLIGGKVLYSLGRELAIWNFSPTNFDVVSTAFNRKTVSIANGRLAYAVKLRSGSDSGFVVGAVELPGPLVRETVDAISTEDLYVLRPGGTIAIDVQCGVHNSEVQAALVGKARANGWSVSGTASLKMVAKMGRHPQQSVTYRQIGGSETQTVTSQPYYSQLQIQQGESTVWSSGTSSGGLSPVVMVQDGESLAAKARNNEQPDSAFFGRVTIPAKVFDTRFKNGFGSSAYGKSGLVPKAMTNLP